MWENSYCRQHVPNLFGVRYGKDARHVFPQGVLATLTLVGGVASVEIARACAFCEVGLPFCSVAVTYLSGMGSAPKLLEQKP